MNLKTLAARIPVLPLALTAFFCMVAFHATVMEDAYITFRVVDNIVHGEGAVWNLGERVQVYTHPLWMLVHIPLYAVWENIFFETLLISLLCAVGTVWLTLRCFEPGRREAVCLFLVPLMVSSTFMIFSSSGFENPLEHVLFAAFGYLLWKPLRAYTWLGLSLCTALSMMNRLDTAVFYLPIWGYLLATRWREVKWAQLALGLVPIVMWEAFSLFYYGFVFPNTKYAKLNTGIGTDKYIELGLAYLLNLLVSDIFAAALLLSMVVVVLWMAEGYFRWRNDRLGLLLSVAAGAVCYTAYVVVIGGTYITGRLVSLQVLAAAWVLLGLSQQWKPQRWLWRGAGVLCVLWMVYPSNDWLQKECPDCFNGVWPVPRTDELRLRNYLAGKIALPEPRSISLGESPVTAGSIGIWGYKLDRKIKVLDFIGLGDALMARLPINRSWLYNMGNLPRDVPAGYVKASVAGDVSEMDPQLGAYYLKLRLITCGDLWDPQRLIEIWKFNRGDYEPLREAYVEAHKKF